MVLFSMEHHNNIKKLQPNHITQPSSTGGDLITARESTQLEEVLKNDAAQFIDAAVSAVSKLAKHTLLLKEDLDVFVEERVRRAVELDSEEVRLARKIATRLVPAPTYSISCVDGRVEKAVKIGFPGRLGGDTKVPAANPLEFVRGKRGGFILLPGSGIAKMLDGLFKQHDLVVQVLDSHVGCAAQKATCLGRGEDPQDAGLQVGVLHSIDIANAMNRYVAETHPTKRILPIQISFDPHCGWAYMGLETQLAMEYAHSQGGCSEEVLRHLTHTGRVIFTGQLAKEEGFARVFELHRKGGAFKNFDLRTNYPESMLAFWQAVEVMVPELLPYIQEKLWTLYPGLASDEPNARVELKERALILLLSAFMGYLNNLTEGGYPYGVHTEEVVAVSSQKYGPFGRKESFHVASTSPTLIPDVLFAVNIVRDNRRSGRVKNRDPKDPVLVIVKVKVAEEEVTQAMWDDVRTRLNWDELVELDWWKMPDDDFETWVTAAHPTIPGSILWGLKQLLKTMSMLYHPGQPSSREIMEGSIVVVPVLVDANRRIQCVVPFLLRGY